MMCPGTHIKATEKNSNGHKTGRTRQNENAQRTKNRRLRNRFQCVKCTLHILHIYLVNLFLISMNRRTKNDEVCSVFIATSNQIRHTHMHNAHFERAWINKLKYCHFRYPFVVCPCLLFFFFVSFVQRYCLAILTYNMPFDWNGDWGLDIRGWGRKIEFKSFSCVGLCY